MSEQPSGGWLANPFIRDYGMVFVLLLLGLLFSALTVRQQHPTGADAGRQVADFILDEHGDSAGVLIVGRPTAEDEEFTTAVAERLQARGATVLDTVNGSAVDARKAIEGILADGKTIDAIAANDVTAKWTVYDRFDAVGSDSIVTPSPYTWPDFLKVSNLLGVANQTAIYAIIAIGMTMVIITAGIDLSVGSLVALASVTSAILIRDLGGGSNAGIGMVIVGMLAGITVCALAGVFNGVMVTAFGIPPFIVTLGMMMMASGLSFRLAEGRSIPELPEAFFWLGRGQTMGVPNPVLLMIVLYIIAHVVMSQMVFGRYVYAIGGNEEAARLSGVPVKRVLLAVYTICGALAGLGGIVLTSQLSAGDPKFGQMYELEVIAAVVVGGTSLMGGQGKILGTLIGAFIIAVIKNGMNLTDVDPFNQKIVLGAVLTGAVLLDTLKRRGGRS
ncbi:ABC transporter permease [Maioricimonas sp. JC845]|uniref:ABC transporter permease n=1 Tax=Maioricimonas sp. JC845 TaxID=3232138 RepID=UPI00345AEB34